MTLDQLVDKYYSELNLNDLYIWRYILTHKKACQEMSISELAKHCNVSKTSILRFTKKISLNGFSELKFYLKMQEEDNQAIDQEFIGNVCDDYVKAIQYANRQNYEEACQLIHTANNVFAYGSGEIQQLATRNLKRLFFKMNKSIYLVYGENEMDFMVQHLTENDVVIIYSLSGQANQAVEFVKACKKRNAKIISLTILSDNPIARYSDVALYFLDSYKNASVHGRNYSPISMFFITSEILFLQYSIYLETHE